MLAAEAAAGQPQALWIAVVGGIISLVSAVTVAWFSFRSSTRTQDLDRDKRYDERIDKENDRLRSENERLTREIYSAREQIAILRVRLVANGLSPDPKEPDG